MNVLVLGASGQLGSDLFRIHPTMASGLELIPLRREQLDLMELEAIAGVINQYAFHVLINCTGYNRVDQAEYAPATAMRLNAHAVRKLAEICHARGARFVQLSTDFVYCGEQGGSYTEIQLPDPINLYGASKAIGECMAMAACGDTLILRTASLFGVNGSWERGGNFVESILRSAQQMQSISVINDVTMSPTGTRDLAKIIFRLLQREAPSGIYHTVNSGCATWYEFAQEILRVTRHPIELVPISCAQYSHVAKRPSNSTLNNAKAAAVVGEIPSWHDALERYLYEKKYI